MIGFGQDRRKGGRAKRECFRRNTTIFRECVNCEADHRSTVFHHSPLYSIYKLTFPDGLIYIGKTSKPVETRIREHFKARSKVGSHCRRFPGQSLQYEILLTTTHWAQAKGLEIACIRHHKARDPNVGLNLTRGGFYDRYDYLNRAQ